MRHGRVVREGEQPLKYVKQHAATINRRRELEIRAETEGANGGGAAMQGLYAENQTEVYVPPPVIDVRFPVPFAKVPNNQEDADNIPRI